MGVKVISLYTPLIKYMKLASDTSRQYLPACLAKRYSCLVVLSIGKVDVLSITRAGNINSSDSAITGCTVVLW